MLKHESKGWVVPAIAITSLYIFIQDCLTPKGVADYIFYFVPVAVSVLHYRPRTPIIAAMTCTVLAIIGFFISPASSFKIDIAGLNRGFAIIAFWVVALLVKRIISNRNIVEQNDWVKTSVNKLSDQIRGDHTVKELGQKILGFMSETLGNQAATLFVRHEGRTGLQFLTGTAYDQEKEQEIVLHGKGLLGQVLQDKKIRFLENMNPGHLKLKSSLGESQTNHLLIIPLMMNDEVLGIIEMGFLHRPDPFIIKLADEIPEMLGIALNSAETRAKLSTLLQLAQKHAEELQAQQEELRVINEELEQQSKALKESHAKLENQQAELEQSNQQLEEQTQELENQKNLLNAKNSELEVKTLEVQKSSNYKSEFMANMSHELRTPLNSSLILAKLLADNKSGNLTKEQIEYAEIIYNSGNDLLNLINDILDLSKVEAGKLTLVPEIIGIDQVTKNLEKIFAPIAKQKSLEFKIHVDQNVSDLITDRQRLEQILKNFLSNAFKFTEKGGVSLHVYSNSKDVTFAIADTGVGMTPEEQGVIFEAFRQADGTTNRKYGGTGLGLSISKELARLLGGEISVSSTKGQGSTFTLTVPLKYDSKAPAQKVNPIPKPSVPEKTETTVLPVTRFSFKDDREKLNEYSRRMLIIEDDEVFAKILFETAHEMNFGAIVAETGEEGLYLAKAYRPNGIILDVRLPDHSGMIVLDQLKMNTVTRHIPVHVISSEDFSRSALEMGAMGYMLKPVKKDQLQIAFQNMSAMLEQAVKNVLIVEDDKVQRDHLINLIQDKTVKVTAVTTSQEALELLAKQTFDCMIMDLSLPDMSGHELLSRLSSESSTYSFPPVIVYTAKDLTPEEEDKLRLYSGSIIIKGAKSPERLLSEVTLFLHKVENEMPPERQKMLKEFRSREKNLEDRTILIVDDDIRNIYALTAALEVHGAKIQSARNGREAIQKLSDNTDLILMDIMMPEMDGYEAMRKIRKIDKFKETPIIALTAKAMKDDKQKCIEAGANDYLSKPIEVEKLMSLIRVWLPLKRRFS